MTVSDEWDEPHSTLVGSCVLVTPSLDEPERLHGPGGTDRDGHSASFGKLPEQWRGHVVGRRGHDDAIKGTFSSQPKYPSACLSRMSPYPSRSSRATTSTASEGMISML